MNSYKRNFSNDLSFSYQLFIHSQSIRLYFNFFRKFYVLYNIIKVNTWRVAGIHTKTFCISSVPTRFICSRPVLQYPNTHCNTYRIRGVFHVSEACVTSEACTTFSLQTLIISLPFSFHVSRHMVRSEFRVFSAFISIHSEKLCYWYLLSTNVTITNILYYTRTQNTINIFFNFSLPFLLFFSVTLSLSPHLFPNHLLILYSLYMDFLAVLRNYYYEMT